MLFVKSKQQGIFNNLVVLHGLCGSPQNFSAIVKNNKISSLVNSHLLSWHSHKFNMDDQMNNLKQYIQSMPDENVCLMGHSIGAKIIMCTLARYSNELQKKVKGAVIIDMLPFSDRQTSHEAGGIGLMKSYLENLNTLDLKEQTQEQILQRIQEITPNKRVADLLYQNIHIEKKIWKIDIKEIIQNYDDFGIWSGRVLVLAGENSNFVSRTQIHTYKKVFSNIDLEKDVKIIEKASHWVQADQPNILINQVSTFLKEIYA